jgi:hypothetical protein
MTAQAIDDTLAATFPASDPPAWTPGIARPAPDPPTVGNRPAQDETSGGQADAIDTSRRTDSEPRGAIEWLAR